MLFLNRLLEKINQLLQNFKCSDFCSYFFRFSLNMIKFHISKIYLQILKKLSTNILLQITQDLNSFRSSIVLPINLMIKYKLQINIINRVDYIFFQVKITYYMNNNFRYDKLNMLIHLQHQRSHYKRILQAKKNINFKQLEDKTKPVMTRRHQSSYQQASKQRQIKQNNQRLVFKINEINHKNGVLKNMYEESKKRNNSLNYGVGHSSGRSFYKERDGNDKLNKDNLRLAERLEQIKPMIGTRVEWKDHFKKFKSIEKRLTKNSVSYDPQPYLRQTFSQINKNKKRDGVIFSSLSRRIQTQHDQNNQITEQNEQIQTQQNEETSRKLRELGQNELKNMDKVSVLKPKSKKNKKKKYRIGANALGKGIRTYKSDAVLNKNQSQVLKLQIHQILRNQIKNQQEESDNSLDADQFLKEQHKIPAININYVNINQSLENSSHNCQ